MVLSSHIKMWKKYNNYNSSYFINFFQLNHLYKFKTQINRIYLEAGESFAGRNNLRLKTYRNNVKDQRQLRIICKSQPKQHWHKVIIFSLPSIGAWFIKCPSFNMIQYQGKSFQIQMTWWRLLTERISRISILMRLELAHSTPPTFLIQDHRKWREDGKKGT